jgi:hypothetical protein
MTIDLNDPESIAAWVMVWPARHWPQIRFFRTTQHGAFEQAIDAAEVLVRQRLAARKAAKLGVRGGASV